MKELKLGDLVTVRPGHDHWGSGFTEHVFRLHRLEVFHSMQLKAIVDTKVKANGRTGGTDSHTWTQGRTFNWDSKDIVRIGEVGQIVKLVLPKRNLNNDKFRKAFCDGQLFEVVEINRYHGKTVDGNSISDIEQGNVRLIPVEGKVVAPWHYSEQNPFLWETKCVRFVASNRLGIPSKENQTFFSPLEKECFALEQKKKKELKVRHKAVISNKKAFSLAELEGMADRATHNRLDDFYPWQKVTVVKLGACYGMKFTVNSIDKINRIIETTGVGGVTALWSPMDLFIQPKKEIPLKNTIRKTTLSPGTEGHILVSDGTMPLWRKVKETRKENFLDLALTYRINRGQLGGRKMKADRISKDGQFAFFKHMDKDVRVHAKQLTAITPEVIVKKSMKKESDSMKTLHATATSYITSENEIRIAKVERDLMERTETNVAEIAAIREGTKQPRKWNVPAIVMGVIAAIATVVAIVN